MALYSSLLPWLTHQHFLVNCPQGDSVLTAGAAKISDSSYLVAAEGISLEQSLASFHWLHQQISLQPHKLGFNKSHAAT